MSYELITVHAGHNVIVPGGLDAVWTSVNRLDT
ncbi:hypothetical protein ERICIV_00442 [Paenibacillus larvae subsp. larvae]|uniref:Uncharacterized protein n=1 Tax=Paenibacillus larvae subsp. larvae TaxID=147375 RepID=A0A2L1TVM9_9BACL|nr:hypothetical protein ERICIII_00442 [Paenibacillus larvae subsp. larvae]AVF29439.1 hypothetical protein ERICIV_00442 [Paenibacillus larvae subsp. larvae]